jgi:drug/metabolite transporter (DMT)-like permease
MRKDLWRVIAGALIVIVGVVLLLSEMKVLVLNGEVGGILALLAGAVVFGTLWLSNPKEWWPLIPGGIMAGWGLASVLGLLGLPAGLVSLIGFVGSALPFLYIFALDRQKNWWALIPGGIMAFMGVVTLLGSAVGEEWMGTLTLWGIALVFAAIFLVNRRNGWALIPAGVLAVVGLATSPVAPSLSVVGPVALILLGVVVVVRNLLRSK